jgi:hypothetical protein
MESNMKTEKQKWTLGALCFSLLASFALNAAAQPRLPVPSPTSKVTKPQLPAVQSTAQRVEAMKHSMRIDLSADSKPTPVLPDPEAYKKGPLSKKYLLDEEGPSSGGGGDPITLDFLNATDKEVIPWLEDHGKELPKPVDIALFKQQIIPSRIVVLPDVYESCDGTNNGRAVVGCYNKNEKIWFLSRNFYPLDLVGSPMKRNFIMHEIFRALGVEGDEYEQTRSISRFQAIPKSMVDCIVRMRQHRSSQGAELDPKWAVRACERSGAAPEFQACVINLRTHRSSRGGELSVENAVRACERSGADPKFSSCIVKLRQHRSSNGAELGEEGAVRACELSGADSDYQYCVIQLRQHRSSGGAEFDEDDAIRDCRAR